MVDHVYLNILLKNPEFQLSDFRTRKVAEMIMQANTNGDLFTSDLIDTSTQQQLLQLQNGRQI